MAENREYFVVPVEQGSIRISDAVIAAIAAAACIETEGVHSMAAPAQAGDISDIFNKKNNEKGVYLKLCDGACNISLYILVKSGVSVTEVARRAQNAVKNAVEASVSIPITSIDVIVSGIGFQK